MFGCSFSNAFWNKVNDNVLNKLKSWGGLSLAYGDLITGLLKAELDIINYIIIRKIIFVYLLT